MRKFILLGILLLAGLSFAPTDGFSWMGYVESRYACNYLYLSQGYPPYDGGIGLMEIVHNHGSGCEYWTDCIYMEGTDLQEMYNQIWGEGGMYNNGCRGGTSSGFRQNMLQYAIYAADFKAKFLAGLRNYLADGGNRAEIMAEMQDAMLDYRFCLSDAGACYRIPV